VATAAVSPRHWRDALGKPERFADWAVLFEQELLEDSAATVLARWLPRLLPGLSASAAHGVIRVGHASRALTRADTSVRRSELAAALGYWAAAWHRLPASDQPARPPTTAADALSRVPRIAKTRPPAASIDGAFLALEDCPEFGPVIHDLDVERPLDATLGELTEAFARVFLTHANDRLGAIVFTHGITAAAALRALAPHLAEDDARDAVRFAWQTGAALVATFATAEPGDPVAGPALPARAALIDAAIACGDDHAIKLTEACLAEHALAPAPVFLAAAERGVRLLADSPINAPPPAPWTATARASPRGVGRRSGWGGP